MARRPRLEFPGAIYHISSRGNHQEFIFHTDEDREMFLELLKDIIERMNWVCHAYCLMGNHYHLLIEIPDGILSRGMAWLNGVYTQKINRKYGLAGHLFQGRFKTKLVLDDMQFLMTTRYILRNPLEAKIVEDLELWPWSSYQATVGLIRPPNFLFVDEILAGMSMDRELARMLFKEFICMDLKGDDDQLIELFQKIYGEKNNFSVSKRVGPVLDMKNSQGPVPRNQRILSRPSLEDMFADVRVDDLTTRNEVILNAFKSYGYTQAEIAKFLELDRTTVSRAIKKTN